MKTDFIAMVSDRRKNSKYKFITSTHSTVFQIPSNLSESVEYSSGVLLESGEWFMVPEFRTKTYCIPLLQNESFSSVNYERFGLSDFGNILYLCGVHDAGFYLFQRVTPAKQIKKKILSIGATCEYKESSKDIYINESPDAIYSVKDDVLYFRKLQSIVLIFRGIDELYREATDEEVKKFLKNKFIELGEGFTSDNVKTNNRKRIALAIETLNNFSNKDMKTVFKYIKGYCPELSIRGNKFKIHDDDSLKRLLYGIEQRYYTTLVGEEKRLANSVIPLK